MRITVRDTEGDETALLFYNGRHEIVYRTLPYPTREQAYSAGLAVMRMDFETHGSLN